MYYCMRSQARERVGTDARRHREGLSVRGENTRYRIVGGRQKQPAASDGEVL